MLTATRLTLKQLWAITTTMTLAHLGGIAHAGDSAAVRTRLQNPGFDPDASESIRTAFKQRNASFRLKGA